MEGEAGILQQRIQSGAFERRRIEARERIAGEQDEQEKRHRHQRLHRRALGRSRAVPSVARARGEALAEAAVAAE